jgi:CRISPR-associated protein Csx10
MNAPQPMVVKLRITAHSPLTFPTRKPGAQFRESLPYVPGASVYGALGMWFGAREHFDPELFEQILCHNAYPARADDEWVRPLPQTAIQPKGTTESGLSDKLADALVPRVCWERQQPAALIYAPTDEQGRPWEAVGARFYTIKDRSLETRSVTQRTLTRVAINRQRGTAEDQRLYSLLAINEVSNNQPTRFLGSLVLPNRNEMVLQALVDITHLGGRQTTGLGAVEIANEFASIETTKQVAERIGHLTGKFQRQAKLYAQLGGEPWPIDERPIFTINLLSDAILLEDGWAPTNEISSTMLRNLTGIEAKLLRSFTRTSIVGGWNVQWQRPKPTAIATTTGSVFVFQAEQQLDDDAYARLAHLQVEGIGERRQEGYGQVRICDDFHLMAPEERQ